MAKKQIVIIGYGNHAVSILSAASHLELEVIGYVDQLEMQNNPFNLCYLGTDEQYLNSTKNKFIHICGIGDNRQRKSIQEDYESHGFTFTNIIHPQSFVEDKVEIGTGVYIGAFTYINGLSKIGDGVIVNNHTNIDHGCTIESYCHIAPGTSIAGNVKILNSAFIGVGACIIPSIKIGANSVVGAGSVVIRDVKNDQIVVGSPAKPISNG